MSYQRDFERRLKVGIVGVGGHCYRNLLPTMNYLPVRIVAMCDVNEERLRATAARVCLLFKGDATAFHQRGNAGALHGRNMDEYVLAAGFRRDEAEATRCVEKFDRTGLSFTHGISFPVL